MRDWSWTVIKCCWGAWALLWLTLAFFAKRTVARPGGAWAWATGVSAGVVFVVLRATTGTATWHRPLFSTPLALEVLSVALVAVGLWFCAWARVTLGGNWSGSVVLKQNHELIQSGPYALARHPIYTGMLAMVVGSVLDFPSVISYVGLTFVLVVFTLKARREERLMAEHFPEEYAAYRARVKALVPFIL